MRANSLPASPRVELYRCEHIRSAANQSNAITPQTSIPNRHYPATPTKT